MSELSDLYARIPTFSCVKGCGDCCGLVPFSREEWARVKDRCPPGVTILEMENSYVPQRGISSTCPFFDAGCTVYEDRPFMCRLFGTAPERRLTCPHGCKPAQSLTVEKANWMTQKYIRATRIRPAASNNRR